MWMMTDDPAHDAEMHDWDQEKWLKSRPICSICEEHIQSDVAYEINGEYICEDCLEDMKVYLD